jgi:hypothetical protein
MGKLFITLIIPSQTFLLCKSFRRVQTISKQVSEEKDVAIAEWRHGHFPFFFISSPPYQNLRILLAMSPPASDMQLGFDQTGVF